MTYELVIIGCSLGGLSATRTILTSIAKECDTPIVLIQHREQRPESSMENVLRNMIRRFTSRRVEEVEDKTKMERNTIYLAPADYHLLVEREYLSLSADDPVAFARPSIDLAFDTAARNYGQAAIAVVLTGASADGAEGAASIEARGGLVIVQDPATAENGTLPRAALAKLKKPKVLQLDEIGAYVSHLLIDGGANNVARASS